jgi:hypothetical protein
MSETSKELMIGQNRNIWDTGVSDSQYLGHDRDIFANMVMKRRCPNQGTNGLLCAKKKMSSIVMTKLYYTHWNLKCALCNYQMNK